MRDGTPRIVQTIGQDGFGARQLGLAGAATSRLTLPRTTLYSEARGGIDGLSFTGSGYHVAISSHTNPANTVTGHVYRRSSVNVCGNNISTELVTFADWPAGYWKGTEVQADPAGPAIFLYHSTRGVLLARRTTATCP